MRKLGHSAVLAVGFAAAFAAAVPARAAEPPLSLRSFGAGQARSSHELSADGLLLQPQIAAPFANRSGLFASEPMPAFAASTMLSPNMALDVAKGMDIGTRFSSYDRALSPFLSAVTAPYLDLANGGRYTGVTLLPSDSVKLRLGASVNSERLDRFHFDPLMTSGNLALSYDPSQTRSLLGGLSWDISRAIGLDVSGISAERSGVPMGVANAAVIAPRALTNAVNVAARVNLGQGWVTTASFSEGMTQLDQRGGLKADTREQSYAIAIAKHGLFGEDALGLSVSRPAPGMANGFSSLMSNGDLPPLVIGRGQSLGGRAAETDFQLGYVTNFLDGAVALQTNAAYQTNIQGQPGANALSLLSRAKIKF